MNQNLYAKQALSICEFSKILYFVPQKAIRYTSGESKDSQQRVWSPQRHCESHDDYEYTRKRYTHFNYGRNEQQTRAKRQDNLCGTTRRGQRAHSTNGNGFCSPHLKFPRAKKVPILPSNFIYYSLFESTNKTLTTHLFASSLWKPARVLGAERVIFVICNLTAVLIRTLEILHVFALLPFFRLCVPMIEAVHNVGNPYSCVLWLFLNMRYCSCLCVRMATSFTPSWAKNGSTSASMAYDVSVVDDDVTSCICQFGKQFLHCP